MLTIRNIGERYRRALDAARLRLAHPEALWDLALLGCLTGLVAGAVILLFRLAVDGAQAGMLPGAMLENFEAVWSTAQEKSIDLRTAAYTLAISRVVEAVEARGIYP